MTLATRIPAQWAAPFRALNPSREAPLPQSLKDQFIWLFFRLDGRVGRWPFFLGCMFLAVLQALALYQSIVQHGAISDLWLAVFWIIGVASLWCTLALGVKRVHDIGLHGVFAVTLLVPIVMVFAFVLLCVWPGNPGPNQYGNPW